MSRKPVDLTGQRFGRLVALERVPTQPYYASGHMWWKCRCDCGQETLVRSNSLKQGAIRSCGCLRKEHAQIMGALHRRK